MGKGLPRDRIADRLDGVSWYGLKTTLEQLVQALHADDRAEVDRLLFAWDLSREQVAAARDAAANKEFEEHVCDYHE